MSGLDHLRGRAAECEALWRMLGGDAGRMIGQRLSVWQAAIAAVEPDYTPAELEPLTGEDMEDLDPAPTEDDLAAAAEAVARFEGPIEGLTPRDQPPAPDEHAPAPVAAPTPPTRTARGGPTWTPARLELAESMWRLGRTAAEIFEAINRIPAVQPVTTKQEVFNKAHKLGWKRDVPVPRGRPPAAPAPEPAPTPPADEAEPSIEDIKAAIRAGKRAKAIAWDYDIDLAKAQDLCAEVDAESLSPMRAE